jgi:hypothetical protein
LSTNSNIGYKTEDGKVRAVYCHWDGNPEHMIPAIKGYIENRGVESFCKKVDEGRQGGGLRKVTTEDIEVYDDGDGGWGKDGDFGSWDWAEERHAYVVDPEEMVVYYNSNEVKVGL